MDLQPRIPLARAGHGNADVAEQTVAERIDVGFPVRSDDDCDARPRREEVARAMELQPARVLEYAPRSDRPSLGRKFAHLVWRAFQIFLGLVIGAVLAVALAPKTF